MSTSGRSLLLFFLAWAALWGTPARVEEPGTSARQIVQQGLAAEPLQDLREHRDLREYPEPHLTHREVLEAPEPLPSDPLGRVPAKGPGAEPPDNGSSALARSANGPPLSSDILLLIQRQNE